MEDITIDSEYRKENKSTKEQLEATSYVYSIELKVDCKFWN